MAAQYDTAKMRNALARAGITRTALARRAAVAPGTITNVLNGNTANAATVTTVAKALGLEIADVVIPEPELSNADAADATPAAARPEVDPHG